MDQVVAFSALGAFGLVGVAILAVGFLLRREAEEFFTENKEDAKAIRARYQGKFHQALAEEINLTIDRAAAGAASIDLKMLKEKIATEALQPEHETSIGKVGAILAERDAALQAFTKARDKKMDLGGSIIGLGIVSILGGLCFVLPSDVQSADGSVIGLILGIVAIFLTVFAFSSYGDYTTATKKFFELCDNELKNL